MTDIKEWKILHDRAFQGEKFVDVELIKERLGDEYTEFLRLNHRMMEITHHIHNENMLDR